MKYECGLDIAELEKRTSKDYLLTKKMLDVDAKEFLELADGDKKALSYLVKAARIIEKINMQLDSHHNLPFLKYLEEMCKKGDKKAQLTKILFDAQKGIFALDCESNLVKLAANLEKQQGRGLYPENLSKEEFHKILIQMIKDNKIKEVKKILNQRSVVEYTKDKKELVAIDYIDKFQEDFKKIAELLLRASCVSTCIEFNEYLRLQSQAFLVGDAMLDAYADKKWAAMQDTPLEFTITRENYSDEMTETVYENEELSKLLKENDIEVISKDYLGARVGIVNKEGTNYILKVKDYLPLMARHMPYSDDYEQVISDDSDISQTMVDVDLIEVAGDVGAFRAGITLAENLPNNDKLSLTIGGGRRNVYHRQIRFVTSEDAKQKIQEKLDNILEKEFHQYYDENMDHPFTIGHENGHSLGPKEGCEALGKYKSIIEENKADMVSLAMIDLLTEEGLYTEEERKKFIVTYAVDNMLKSKPELTQAHRVRSVMQNYYFIQNEAMKISKEGFLSINIDRMVYIARQMLGEIIQVQLSKDFSVGEKYVLDNFVWTSEMELVSQKLKKISKRLNGKTEQKLADKLFLEQV
ncbi:MAG: hypothetical protein IJ003_04220 [Candidatus Gastranaerophilales bacterium]|nr:hypothetical protein [Candidatus Gastranaerophilales bacterium]